MIVREEPEKRKEILNTLRIRGQRNDGRYHVSDLQYCLIKRSLRDRLPMPEEDVQTLKYAAGHNVHELLEGIRQWRMVMETEVEKDGIVGTPDLLGSGEVVEIKSTWKSIRQFREDFTRAAEHYLDQAKTYCYMTDRTTAQIDVLCFNGDYSYPMNPDLYVATAEFSIFELENQWAHISKRRDTLGGLYVQIQANVPDKKEEDPLPEYSLAEYMGWERHPYTSVIGYDWECSWCPYLKFCRPPGWEQIVEKQERAEIAKLPCTREDGCLSKPVKKTKSNPGRLAEECTCGRRPRSKKTTPISDSTESTTEKTEVN